MPVRPFQEFWVYFYTHILKKKDVEKLELVQQTVTRIRSGKMGHCNSRRAFLEKRGQIYSVFL